MATIQENIDRRGQSRDLIKNLVESRQDTLSLFNELASRKPFNDDASVHDLLQTFCQSLIDYTASSHFRLYQYIENRTERRAPVLELAERIYPRIVDLTQTIVDFNDKYDCDTNADNLGNLADDLSRVGEALADRIELEDKIIQVLVRE